jgi:hypothetical protein
MILITGASGGLASLVLERMAPGAQVHGQRLSRPHRGGLAVNGELERAAQRHPHLLAVDDVDRGVAARVIRTRQVLSSAVP